MTWRISAEFLTHLCDRITEVTGSPIAPIKDGKPQNGAFRIDEERGGFCLRRVVKSDGTDEDVFRCGYIKPADLANLMSAYIKGLTERTKGKK